MYCRTVWYDYFVGEDSDTDYPLCTFYRDIYMYCGTVLIKEYDVLRTTYYFSTAVVI